MKWLIPAGLATFDVVEAVICLAQKDYARAWYWVAAAQITAATIFLYLYYIYKEENRENQRCHRV